MKILKSAMYCFAMFNAISLQAMEEKTKIHNPLSLCFKAAQQVQKNINADIITPGEVQQELPDELNTYLSLLPRENLTPTQALCDALKSEKLTVTLAKDLLELGATLKVFIDNKTPLNVAIDQDNEELARLFLMRKAVSICPLIRAAYIGSLSIAHTLVEFKAEIDEKDDSGYTALDYAVGKGADAIVEFLIAKGANVKNRSKLGFTPIFRAVFKNNAHMLRILFNNGAHDDEDISRCYGEAGTLLGMATQKGNSEIVDLLLQRGANPHIRMNMRMDMRMYWNMTPFLIAAYNRRATIIKRLHQHCSSQYQDINQINGQGDTALMLATGSRDDDTVAYLLEHGADAELRNRYEAKALDAARTKKSIEMLIIPRICKKAFAHHALSSNIIEHVTKFVIHASPKKNIYKRICNGEL